MNTRSFEVQWQQRSAPRFPETQQITKYSGEMIPEISHSSPHWGGFPPTTVDSDPCGVLTSPTLAPAPSHLCRSSYVHSQ